MGNIGRAVGAENDHGRLAQRSCPERGVRRKIVDHGWGLATVRVMPVEFLTDDQAEAYGKFAEEPTRPELERFFFLDDVDRDLIALRRTKYHQLGFALQMCTVRYVGLFLEDPLAVPWPVVEHLAAQLGVEDPSCVKRYTERLKTAYEQAWEIRDAYGYHPYDDPEWGRKFRTFLHGRAWTHAEGPVALFNQAVGWLRRNRVLLPGVSVLARQVSEVRARSRRSGCMPPWPGRLSARTRCCRWTWWPRWCRRRADGTRSWSGCAGLRRGRRARRSRGRWSGSMRSVRSSWGG